MKGISRWLVDLLLLALVGITNFPAVQAGVRDPRVLVAGIMVAGGVLSVAFVVLRRRMPGVAFAVQVVWCTAAPLPDGGFPPLLALLVGLYAVAARRTVGRLGFALAACLLPATVQTADLVRWMGDTENGVAEASWWGASVMVVAGAVAAVGYRLPRAAVARRAATAAAEARREERLVVARELHDIVAHSVSIMVLQAAGARSVLDTDPDRAAAALDVIQDASAQSMDELRRLLHLLRAEGEGDGDRPLPGVEAIDALVEQSRAGGLPVEVTVEGEPGRLDPSVSTAAYRVVQEALTNTRKHAADGVTATVTLSWMPDGLHLIVEDRSPVVEDRSPTPQSVPARHGLSTGHGLLGLGERVAAVGGVLLAEPTADGFLVGATLPLARWPISTAATR